MKTLDINIYKIIMINQTLYKIIQNKKLLILYKDYIIIYKIIILLCLLNLNNFVNNI